MGLNGQRPLVVVDDGLEPIVRPDQALHGGNLQRAEADVVSHSGTLEHLRSKRAHYKGLLVEAQAGGGKFNADALAASLNDIQIELRRASDALQGAHDRVAHFRLVVTTLQVKLEGYGSPSD